MALSHNYWRDHDTIVVLDLPGLERVRRYSPGWPKIEVQDHIEVRYRLPRLLSTRILDDKDIYLDWMKAENLEFDPKSDCQNGFDDWKHNIRRTHLSPEEEEPFAKFSKLLPQLQTCHDKSMNPYETGPFIMPRHVILKHVIENGDFIGNQRWLRKCKRFRALGDNAKLIRFAVLK